MIGRFHEFSVQAPDVLESIAFYERLGFTQASTGEAWPYPYAVVSDGRCALGLHQHELPQPLLPAFVLPGLLDRLVALEERGIEIVDRRLGGDVFNEASLATPDGQMIRLLEARTYSPAQRAPGDSSRLGWFEELALPVADAAAAVRYWERLGFVPTGEADEPWPHLALTSDSLNVALLGAGLLPRAALRFSDAAMDTRIAALRDSGIGFARRPPGGLDPGRHALLVAPEGTQLLLTTSE